MRCAPFEYNTDDSRKQPRPIHQLKFNVIPLPATFWPRVELHFGSSISKVADKLSQNVEPCGRIVYGPGRDLCTALLTDVIMAGTQQQV